MQCPRVAGDVDGADSDENSEWLRELIIYNRQQAWYACIDLLNHLVNLDIGPLNHEAS